MDIYIQKANFNEAFSMDEGGAEDIKKLLHNYDWFNEIELYEKMKAEADDCCPVCLGIMDDKAHHNNQLQITIYRNETNANKLYYEAMLMYHDEKRAKKLKFLPLLWFLCDRMEYFSINREKDVEKAIDKFCARDMNYFLDKIAEEKISQRYR
ncbi:hypothetical protein AAEX28_08530 [Lentisphaerota bacterium WC36G]|nr:hypothetical protein LJT99_11385 [Lentisphaerae bacterium WC36]